MISGIVLELLLDLLRAALGGASLGPTLVRLAEAVLTDAPEIIHDVETMIGRVKAATAPLAPAVASDTSATVTRLETPVK